MAKYQQDVQTLLEKIGGKGNIQAVSHCMTRMRFVLVDPKKADEKAIEQIPSVKGTFTQAGQYQVTVILPRSTSSTRRCWPIPAVWTASSSSSSTTSTAPRWTGLALSISRASPVCCPTTRTRRCRPSCIYGRMSRLCCTVRHKTNAPSPAQC